MSDCSTRAWDVPMSNRYTHRFGDAQWHEPRKRDEYPGMRRIEKIVFTDSTEHIVNYPFVMVDKEVWAITLDNGEAYMFHERLADANGELCAKVNEQEKRMSELESLVRDMDYCIRGYMSCDDCEIRPCRIGERISKLGIKVDK